MAGLGQDMAFHHRRQLSQLRRKQRGDRWRFWIFRIIGTKGELDRGHGSLRLGGQKSCREYGGKEKKLRNRAGCV